MQAFKRTSDPKTFGFTPEYFEEQVREAGFTDVEANVVRINFGEWGNGIINYFGYV
jgi:hypothetical protein